MCVCLGQFEFEKNVSVLYDADDDEYGIVEDEQSTEENIVVLGQCIINFESYQVRHETTHTYMDSGTL